MFGGQTFPGLRLGVRCLVLTVGWCGKAGHSAGVGRSRLGWSGAAVDVVCPVKGVLSVALGTYLGRY